MPISSIGSSASLIPLFEHRGRETRTTEQQVTLAQVEVSPSGNGEQTDPERRVTSRTGIESSDFELTYNRRLQFVLDHDSNEVIVKVIDNTTDEVVRVLPPEELQRLHRGLQEGSLLSELV